MSWQRVLSEVSLPTPILMHSRVKYQCSSWKILSGHKHTVVDYHIYSRSGLQLFYRQFTAKLAILPTSLPFKPTGLPCTEHRQIIASSHTASSLLIILAITVTKHSQSQILSSSELAIPTMFFRQYLLGITIVLPPYGQVLAVPGAWKKNLTAYGEKVN